MTTEAAADLQRRNVELVEDFLAVMKDQGLAGLDGEVERFWHPDLEWSPGMLSFGRETYRGYGEYREYVAEAARHSSAGGGAFMVDEVVARGDERVLVLGQIRYEDGDGSAPFKSEYALLLQVVDGRFRAGRSFLSHRSAEKAADA
jgi:ketosteroid isomerase-like protein